MAASTVTDDGAFVSLAHADAKVAEHRLSIEKKSFSSSTSEDIEVPSDEDLMHLRRVHDSIPWKTYAIAYLELAERFSFYGSTVVFTNFIQQKMPPGSTTGAGGADGQSGALGMGQRASTGLVTFNNFWAYVTPLFGAYIADSYLGRFKTIAWSIVICLVGHALLITSAAPSVLKDPNGALGCFVIAVIIMGAGTGGFKSNISPLIAEQYTGKLRVETRKNGERVVIDPALTTSRIYMWFYFFVNIGALIGQITMVYAEKYVGFYLAFLLPTIVYLSAPVVLFLGRNIYVTTPPTGSILPSCSRVVRLAMKNTFSWNPVRFYRNLNRPENWNKAKPSNMSKEVLGESGRPSWLTWDDQWVDEVRRGIKACAVFVWFPVYWLTYNQLNNNLPSQAAAMETHGLPNDILSNLDPFALIILIPITDRFVYPALARYGIRFTPIKRITWGFITGAAAMLWAALVQYYIYKTSPCGYKAATCEDDDGNLITSPLNVWLQSGSYILIAISEIFASITGLEYAFMKAPKNMRSMVMAVFLFMSAISYAIGEAFVSVSADPLLIWNYGSMGVLAFLAGIGFWFSFRHLDAEEEKLNRLSSGDVESRHPHLHPEGNDEKH